jgi:hypothetical protein
VWLVLLFALLYLLIYVPVMLAEAETLSRLFPAEYEAYSAGVPMFVPRLTRYQTTDSRTTVNKLDPSLYLRHKEYHAALGYLVVVGFLIAKIYVTR